jgi:CRP-like cAMP-binding protein
MSSATTSATPGAVSVEEVFAGVPLLKHLSARQLSRLARLATRRSYRPGAVIVREGDTSMSFYVVLSGRVRIERASETGGAPLQFGELGPMGFFGEMGLIDDLPRAATVVAVEPTECALLAKWDFQNELRNDPEIALALLPVLSQRIRELDVRLGREQAEARVA